ncbi:hypothetical protein SLEP1_g24254 [Rubroshorea leprosula]|nr:hypothetical protein SLEP1_g24254 [Rubroshorea leprosula]
MPGKPKKKRNPEEWEGKKKMGKQGRQMTCQKCFQKGHNSRSCKGQPQNVAQMKNEPFVEQPPPVEDNQPPHGEDNQPRIAEEELVNMTQEDPPVSQVVSLTPPVQQATTPIIRKKKRAKSADRPKKAEKRARKNTPTPTMQKGLPSVPPSEIHSQSTKTQKVKHAYPKGKGKSERILSFGYAQKRATRVGDRGIPVVTLTPTPTALAPTAPAPIAPSPTAPSPTTPAPIAPTVPALMAPPSITATTPSRNSRQFVTATNLQALLWEKRRQKEGQKEEEALGRWAKLLTKIHTDKQSNV